MLLLLRYMQQNSPPDIYARVNTKNLSIENLIYLFSRPCEDGLREVLPSARWSLYEFNELKSYEFAPVTGHNIKKLKLAVHTRAKHIFWLLRNCINIEELNIDINNKEGKLGVASLDTNPQQDTEQDKLMVPMFYSLKTVIFTYNNCNFEDSNSACLIARMSPNLTSFRYIYTSTTAPMDYFFHSLALYNPKLKELIVEPIGAEVAPTCDVADRDISIMLKACPIEKLEMSYLAELTGGLFSTIGQAKKLKELTIHRGDPYDGTKHGRLKNNIQFGGGVLENLQVLRLQGDWDETIVTDVFFDSLIENVPNLREFHLSVWSDESEDLVDLNPLKKIFSAYKLDKLTLELNVCASDDDVEEFERLAEELKFSLRLPKTC